MTEMTKVYLKKLCKDHGLYSTPYLNDKLYLHYKGFHCIANLEEYTGLKSLWLEGNGLPRIEGLENQPLLRSLYIHENMIEAIQGLDSQIDMDTINFSKNYISKIENLSHMTKLTSIIISNNVISSADGVRHILEIPSLQTLDIQHNRINDIGVVEIFAQMPDLRVLYLMGNPVVKDIKNYRKTIVYRCQKLTYLDDRPVFDEERRRVNAWGKVLDNGGSAEEALEAEREELRVIRKEKDDADTRNYLAFQEMMREGLEIRRLREQEKLAAEAAGGAPEINPHSGEAIVHVPESEVLRKAREARWGIVMDKNTADLPAAPSAQASSIMPPLPPAPEPTRKGVAIEDVDDEELYRSNTDLWKEVMAETSAAMDTAGLLLADNRPPADGVAEEKTVVVASHPEENTIVSDAIPDSKPQSKIMSMLDTASVAAATSTKIQVEEALDLEELD
jgi:dynein assembly factor 1